MLEAIGDTIAIEDGRLFTLVCYPEQEEELLLLSIKVQSTQLLAMF